MYFPLHCHSHYSLLDGLSKPDKIASRITDLNLPGCALTDHGTISGIVEFAKAMKKANKKAIFGSELYVSDRDSTIREQDNKSKHLVVLAKNLAGWRALLKITSESNQPENFYRRPRLDLDKLAKHSGNLVAISGHIGSTLAASLFVAPEVAYNSKLTYTEIRGFLKGNWQQSASDEARRTEDIFGKGNFYIEIQLMDQETAPAQKVLAECLRKISSDLGIPSVATPDAHYPSKEDAIDQRILLCSALQTTIPEVHHKLSNNDDVQLGTFFKSNNYHIPSFEEMQQWHTEAELKNTLAIAESCELYNIFRNPILPQFECPHGYAADEYLRKLCREGWDRFIKGRGFDEKVYAERVKSELEVLQGAGLSPYMLIVSDIINYVRQNGWLPGPGRGSASGCLVSYLTGITSVDPIKYDLMFERFYNAGRNTKDRVSMPDIDMDIPTAKREQIIEYIKNKYGGNKRVCQMMTYQTMKGRRALKDVLRAYGGVSFETMNQITRPVPDEATIADDLQEMREEEGSSSIIRWTLENEGDKLKEFCTIDENGVLSGPLAKKFEQAIRLEGTKCNQSKHAAGVIISPVDLDEICPMVLDTKTKSLIAGMEMGNLEDIGLIKFDVLGVNALDKLMGIQQIAETGDIV